MAPLFIPRRAFGANDRLSFGIIGTGNRGSYLHPAFMKLGAECVAVCDTYEPYMTRAKALSPAGCKTYADYHELIAHPGLDFVVVATPDHQHRPMLYAALEAGKDVYLEKPFSLNMAQSAEMVSRVRQTDRIVQVRAPLRRVRRSHRTAGRRSSCLASQCCTRARCRCRDDLDHPDFANAIHASIICSAR